MSTNAGSQRNQSWVDFAGVMLAIAGIFQMIFGAAVLNQSQYLINKILYGNMEAWGWAYLIIGLILLGTAWFVFQRNPYAEVFGVVVAAISLAVQASVIAYQPIWSVIVVVVDILIIYGLVAHGDIRGMKSRT